MEIKKLSSACYSAPEVKVASFVAEQGYAGSVSASNVTITMTGSSL